MLFTVCVLFPGVFGESFNRQETTPDLSIVQRVSFFNTLHSSA